MSAITIIGVVAALYFAPAIVALARNHRQRAAIALLNLLLGWTVIGWVVAIVWAMTTDTAPMRVDTMAAVAPVQSTPPTSEADLVPCSQCAEPIRPAAKVCRFCNAPLQGLTG